jgi:hypothetical protein
MICRINFLYYFLKMINSQNDSSVSLNKEKICHEISEDKIAVCKKTQGLRSGNFSDLNSACSKVLVVPVKIFQFHDMHYESERYRDAANGLIAALSIKN